LHTNVKISIDFTAYTFLLVPDQTFGGFW
jgi:hypothetical protein